MTVILYRDADIGAALLRRIRSRRAEPITITAKPLSHRKPEAKESHAACAPVRVTRLRVCTCVKREGGTGGRRRRGGGGY